MNRTLKQLVLLVLILLFAVACSVEISSESPTATRPAATNTAPAPEEEEDTETAVPTASTDETDEPATDEEPAGEETEEAPAPAGTPPAWASLGLSGELVFIAFNNEQRQNIHKLDLETGELQTLFESPEGTLVTDVAVSPDGSQIVFAYAPPVPEGEIQFGFTDLYIMPTDGSAEPEVLVARSDDTETFFNLSWPLDDYIYYAHFVPTIGSLGERIFASRIERLNMADGTAEPLVENASWPRLSRDGTRMAYVLDQTQDMIIADPDGSNPEVIIEGGEFPAVDAPLFSLDHEWFFFSAIEPEQNSLSWLDRLMGVRPAYAHNVPSDWWRMNMNTGEMERLTNLYEIGMYGDVSEDGRRVAFITSSGLQVMNLDGSGVFRLLSIPATGTLNWIWE